jgi:two-component system, LytTR family, sensor histidine kinase AlgZ
MSRRCTASSGRCLKTDGFFLPDFCTARSVVTVVVVAQLTAFVLTLARPAGMQPWTDLLRLSLFLQWIALVSAGVLCVSRGWLARLRPAVGVLAAFGALVATATLLAEAAWWTAHLTGTGAVLVSTARAEFLLRTFGLSMIVSAVVLRYLWIQHQWRQRVRSEASTRFAALQARIRPHFLFNSMNTIAALTRTDAEAAEQVTEDLADLFRASLAEPAGRVTLANEFELCRRYARIESRRLGARLSVEWRVEDVPVDARVPGLLVQPLVENAIYHGVEPSPHGGTVSVTGSRDGDRIEIEVRNALPPDRTGPRKGLRIALDNVAERLALAFPGQGTLDARAEGDEFIVTMAFPYELEDARPGG